MSAGDPAGGIALLDQALALWRGEPLAELGDLPTVATDRLRLAELQVRARERRCDALLAVGRPDAAVTDLQHLVAEHPLRERLWARLVTALYAADRQAEALDALRRCAELLREELGIDPGPELRDLEQAVLRQDPKLLEPHPAPRACRSTPAPSPAPVTEPELVGRRTELAHLQAVAGQVSAGRAAVVVVEGEAGIGKTRLAEAAAEAGRAAGWSVAWSRCADDAGAPALWPWTQALEQLGQAGADAGGRRGRRRRGPVPALPGPPRPADGRRGRPRPVLVVLDDLQGADTTSVQLLGLLARHLPRAPVLLVVTARTVGEQLPEAVTDCLARLAREPSATCLRLTGLGADDVATLLDRAARAPPATGRWPRPCTTAPAATRSSSSSCRAGWSAPTTCTWTRARAAVGGRGAAHPAATGCRRRPGRCCELAAVAGREVTLDLLEAAGSPGRGGADRAWTPRSPSASSSRAPGPGAGGSPTRWCRRCWSAACPALRRARLHARLGAALEQRGAALDDALVERLAHHFVEALPVVGTGPGPAVPGRRRAARPGRGWPTARPRRTPARRCSCSTRPSRTPPAPGTTCSPRSATTCCAAASCMEAREVVGEAITVARQLDDRECLAQAAAVWGSVTVWNWRPHGIVDDDMVALLEDLVAERSDRRRSGDRPAARHPRHRARLRAGRPRACGPPSGPSSMARRIGDPELLGRTLNNFSLAVWGRPGAAEVRLAAADESLELAGHGLPRRTEFVAHLHRAALRLHLGDLAGFEADHAEARRLAVSLSGPEVRPHVLWQAGGLAWLRGQRRPGRGADHRGLRAVPAGDPARAARLRRAPVHPAPGRPPAGRRDPAAGRDRRRGQPAAAGDGGAGGGGVRRPGRGPAAARPLGPHAGPRLGQRRRRSTCRRSRRCGWATSPSGPRPRSRCCPTAGGRRCSGRRRSRWAPTTSCSAGSPSAAATSRGAAVVAGGPRAGRPRRLTAPGGAGRRRTSPAWTPPRLTAPGRYGHDGLSRVVAMPPSTGMTDAGHVGAGPAGQVDDDAGHVVGAADPAQRRRGRRSPCRTRRGWRPSSSTRTAPARRR